MTHLIPNNRIIYIHKEWAIGQLWEFVNCASNRVLAWIFGYGELDYDPIEHFFLAFYMLSPEEIDASMEEIVCYYFVNSPFSRFILWNALVKSNWNQSRDFKGLVICLRLKERVQNCNFGNPYEKGHFGSLVESRIF